MDSVSVDALVSLGFTPTEAKVYCTMVSESKMNGYQIAKSLMLSRSSVYAALENLLDKGAILAIPGETNEYSIVEPKQLIEKILSNYSKHAEIATKSLEKLVSRDTSKNFFLNIQGLNNINYTICSMIKEAKKEILISSSMSLAPYKEYLESALKIGVRIIVFSMIKLDLLGMELEFYGGSHDVYVSSEQRFSIVVDNNTCLVCSNDKEEFHTFKQFMNEKDGALLTMEDKDFLGMKSNNRLMVNIIQEHFHFDVYLHKLRIKNNGERIITHDIQIGSLMERGNS